jgi:phage gp36-like protein
MGYATAADLDGRITQSELLRLTDETDSGQIDTATIAAALESADTEIDSYLAARYTLPLADPQPLLASLAIDIAIWNLYSLDDSGVPENRKDRYQAAVATLGRLSSGKQTLGAPEEAVGGSEAAVFSGPDRTFNRTNMKDL